MLHCRVGAINIGASFINKLASQKAAGAGPLPHTLSHAELCLIKGGLHHTGEEHVNQPHALYRPSLGGRKGDARGSLLPSLQVALLWENPSRRQLKAPQIASDSGNAWVYVWISTVIDPE